MNSSYPTKGMHQYPVDIQCYTVADSCQLSHAIEYIMSQLIKLLITERLKAVTTKHYKEITVFHSKHFTFKYTHK